MLTLLFENFPDPNRILIFLRSFLSPFLLWSTSTYAKMPCGEKLIKKENSWWKFRKNYRNFLCPRKFFLILFLIVSFGESGRKYFNFICDYSRLTVGILLTSGATVNILTQTLNIQTQLHWTKRMFMLVKIRTKISLTCKHSKAFQNRFNPAFNNTSQQPPPFRGFLISSSAQNKHLPHFIISNLILILKFSATVYSPDNYRETFASQRCCINVWFLFFVPLKVQITVICRANKAFSGNCARKI